MESGSGSESIGGGEYVAVPLLPGEVLLLESDARPPGRLTKWRLYLTDKRLIRLTPASEPAVRRHLTVPLGEIEWVKARRTSTSDILQVLVAGAHWHETVIVGTYPWRGDAFHWRDRIEELRAQCLSSDDG